MQTKTKLLGLCLAVVSTNLFALPQLSPTHVPDGASINPAQSHAAHLHIDQTSQRAILNWQQFNIAAKESVHFQQPANGFILNRVNPAQGASQIAGKISANGNVIISNAAGIHFGPTARVDVAGLIATTANITDANFKAGNYQFKDESGLGYITNEGVIASNAEEHGFVALIAPNVRNKGKITASMGKIGLYSTTEFVMSFDNNNLLHFKVPAKVVGELDGDGVMRANEIAFSHHHAQDVLDNAIHIPDHHIASSVKKVGNVIILSADKGHDVLLAQGSIQKAKQVKPVLRPSSKQKASENVEFLVTTNYAMKTSRIYGDYFNLERTADGFKDSVTAASSTHSTQTKATSRLTIINEEGETYYFSKDKFTSQEVERNYLNINRVYLGSEAQEAMGQHVQQQMHLSNWDSSRITELSDSLFLSMPISDLEDVAGGVLTLPASSRPASPDSVHSLGSDLSDWSSDTSSVRSDSPVMIEHENADSRPATPDSARSLGSDWSDSSDAEYFDADSEFVFLSPQELAASLFLSQSKSESPVIVEHKDADVDSILSSSWSDIGSFHTTGSTTPVAVAETDYDLAGLSVMGAANIAEVGNVDYDLRGLDVMGAANTTNVNPQLNVANNPAALVNATATNLNPQLNAVNNVAAVFNAPVTQKVKVKMSFSKPQFAKVMTEKGELIEYAEAAADDIDKVIIES